VPKPYFDLDWYFQQSRSQNAFRGNIFRLQRRIRNRCRSVSLFSLRRKTFSTERFQPVDLRTFC